MMAVTSGDGEGYSLTVDEAYARYLEEKIRDLKEKNAQLRRRRDNFLKLEELRQKREAKSQTATEMITKNSGTLKRTFSSTF
ncbi:hypothetical protein Ancab_027783 [Ancistrocladus abbreviatus]